MHVWLCHVWCVCVVWGDAGGKGNGSQDLRPHALHAPEQESLHGPARWIQRHGLASLCT